MASPFSFPTQGASGSPGAIPASSVTYAPLVPGDWSPPPADAQAALDQAAARLTALEDPVRPGTASLTTVPLTTASALVLAANASRLGFAAKNTGGQRAYLAFAATASTAAFTADLDPGATYVDETGYTGPVSGVTSASTTILCVTELTP